MDEDMKKFLDGKSIPEQRRICKAMGREYKTPSIVSQILGKGLVDKRHRGRAKDDSPYIIIPEVHLANGRVLPGLMVDPRIARAAAQEMLRIANEQGY